MVRTQTSLVEHNLFELSFDVCFLQGFPALKSYIENYTGPRKSPTKVGVYLDGDVAENLSKAAESQGISAQKLATKAFAEFLRNEVTDKS